MTDHTAPERIVAWATGVQPQNGGAGLWVSDPEVNYTGAEYIRADLHRDEVDALVAALTPLLVKAHTGLEWARFHLEDEDKTSVAVEEGFDAICDALALTPDDARAALRAHTVVEQGSTDRADKAALEAAVRRALEGAADCCIPHNDDDSLDRQAKLECALAIRALAENPAQFIKED